MTNTINVPRELLENIVLCYNEGEFELGTLAAECHTILSAPSPAGLDGLDVFITDCAICIDVVPEKTISDAKVVLAKDAKAFIDGLRGENERIRLNIAEYNEAIACYQSERDQQAQRIGELEGLLREVAASLAWNAHGECRAIHDGPIMPSQMAIDAVKAALGGSL